MAFQWLSFAVIVGGVSLRYWHLGQAGRMKHPVVSESVEQRTHVDDMSWLSLSEPADGGVSGRDSLSALSLNENHQRRHVRRIA
jgi:hypothetical protein